MPEPNYVLIVDDDIVLARQWSVELISRGYEVDICTNIDNGLDASLRRWPDAIIVDAFFRDSEGKPTGSGGVLFCTKLEIYAQKNDLELPYIVGVTASEKSEYFPIDVFAQISSKLMPKRLKKPFDSSDLADAIAHGLN
jgi:CheY-like chemotaxis protein